MMQALMTNHAKEKIQKLEFNNTDFKLSLNKFLDTLQMYSRKSKITNVYSNYLSGWKNTYRKQLITRVDDTYIYRDKDLRYVFTIQKNENNMDTAIIIDVLDKFDINDLRDYIKKKKIKSKK